MEIYGTCELLDEILTVFLDQSIFEVNVLLC